MDGLLFLKDDGLDADPSRSRGFRPSAPSSIGRRPGCVIHVLVHVVFEDLPYVLVHFGSSGFCDILMLRLSSFLQKNKTEHKRETTQGRLDSIFCQTVICGVYSRFSRSTFWAFHDISGWVLSTFSL